MSDTPYPGPYTMQPAKHGTCPVCGRVAFLPHDCPPVHTVHCARIHGEALESGDKLRADSPEQAAEIWAKQNSLLAYLVGQFTVRVSVLDAVGRVSVWDVKEDVEPRYMALLYAAMEIEK